MKILITKKFVEEKLAAQIERNKKFVENSANTKSELKEIIEDDFLSSEDLVAEVEDMIENEEAEFAQNINIDEIQTMRGDACRDIIESLNDIEFYGLYEQKAGARRWDLQYSSRCKEDVLKEIQRYADIDAKKTEDADKLEDLKTAARDECYSFDQIYYRVTNCDDSYLSNEEMRNL